MSKQMDNKTKYKQAFIDAWQEHHGMNEENLLSQLRELQESYKDSNYFNEMIDIPFQLGDPFQSGPTGKNEREYLVNLDHEELKILLAMAWHRRHGTDLPLKLKNSISSGLYGWFEVKDKQLLKLIKTLQQKLKSSELPIIESLSSLVIEFISKLMINLNIPYRCIIIIIIVNMNKY